MNTTDVDPLQFTTATRSYISSQGTKDIHLRLVNRNYTWKFRIAQVTQLLLGADFLEHHDICVDIEKRRLLVTYSFRATLLGSTVGNPITTCSIKGSPCEHLITEYDDVFKPELCQHPGVPANTACFPHNDYWVTYILLFSASRTLEASRLRRHHFLKWNVWASILSLLAIGPFHYT